MEKMQIGEVKYFTIKDKNIRVEYVGEDLYVVNDVVVCPCDGYDLFGPDHLYCMAGMRDDPVFPYPGPENDSVIGIVQSANDKSKFVGGYWDLGTFEKSTVDRVVDSLRKYRRENNVLS